MSSKLVDDALKRATPEKQQENTKNIDRARQNIDGKTMKNVDEVTAPKPRVGEPDPSGAARTRLDTNFKEKIESIQQGGHSYYSRGPETSPDLAQKAVAMDHLKNAEKMQGGNHPDPSKPDPQIEY